MDFAAHKNQQKVRMAVMRQVQTLGVQLVSFGGISA
jgi:hypothetical protein